MRKNRTLPLHQNLALAYLQALQASFSKSLLRRLSRRTSTGAAIKEYCAQKGIAHKPITLAPICSALRETADAPHPTLHCVTPPSALPTGPTILYFHGGGYINPLQAAGHIPFALQCASACKAARIMFLEYSLAPEYPYPTQLIQAVTALHYLLNDLRLSPEDIVLIGDSAGGQLVGSLLAHLAKPSPYAESLDLGSGQLRAVVFVSPYITLHGSENSYELNKGKDYLDREQILEISEEWKPRPEDVWANLSEAGNASRQVWSRFFATSGRGLVKKTLVTVGTAEVFLDGCRHFAKDCLGAVTIAADRNTRWETLKLADVLLIECEGEVHIQPTLDAAVNYTEGIMALAILTWLSQAA